jgi:elongation factor G
MSKTAAYRPENIRNIVLLGAQGSGKTTLAEAVLHRCGAIARVGTVEQETTAGDFEQEARAHHHSTNSSLLFATREGRELNLLDTPGHPDFMGYAVAALRAVETAVIVVSAVTGVDYATRRLFHAAGEAGLARVVVVNKMDANPSGLAALVTQLRTVFGNRLHCMNLPTRGGADVVDCFDEETGASDFGSVKEVHAEIVESTVELDDAEMEAYLAGRKIDVAQLRQTMVRAMKQGHVVPILFASARTQAGVDDLVHVLSEESPSPLTGRARRLLQGDALLEIPCDVDKPFLAQVFKVAHDGELGQLAMLRVLQGTLDAATEFVCGQDKQARKAGVVLKVEGRDHPEVEAVAFAGDLVALAHCEDIHVDQVLHAASIKEPWAVPRMPYPTPLHAHLMDTGAHHDDVKITAALSRLEEEDPTFRHSRYPLTRQWVLSGLGDEHLKVMVERLKNRFGQELKFHAPTILYRETITGRAEGYHRHKAKEFGEVFLRVEPLPRGGGLQVRSQVFGGAIPAAFLPAVEQGIHDAMAEGVLKGFPVHDLGVVITDGKAAADSNALAFRTAGRMALKDALQKAHPVLLEPVVNLEVTVPEAQVDTVTKDLQALRGDVLGLEAIPGGLAVIRAQAPLSELGGYEKRLADSTQGKGSFMMELSHHSPVPQHA